MNFRSKSGGENRPMKRIMHFLFGLVALVVLFHMVPTQAFAQGSGATFYVEEPKDGRIFVFYYMNRYAEWKQGGEIGASITRISYGPNGETVVFDSNEAVNMYNYKHNLPLETFKAPPAPPAPQDKLPYKFSGYMFGDFYYNTGRDPGIALLPNVAAPFGPEDFNSFQFRRIYFTFDDQISDKFSTRFRLEADSAALSSNGKISVFVKDAYLKWADSIGAGHDFYFGMQPTPAYDISEAAWAYRSLEKTIMDLRGTVPSRDIGATLRGRLGTSGKYNYWVMVGNGSGNNPETDKFKRLYFNFWWKPSPKFQATLYQDYRALPDIADPNNAAGLISNNSYTTAWFVNYGEAGKYGLGYEGFFTKTQNGNKFGAAAPFNVADKTTTGHSFWGWYNFNPIVGVVGRYDLYEPNTDGSGDKRDLFIASLVLKPHKNVFIMPNLYVEKYEGVGPISIKNSVTPRITFYYIFL